MRFPICFKHSLSSSTRRILMLKLIGDVRFDEAEPIVEAVTPVPGGVGTVTTSVLVGHVVDAASAQ